MPFLQLKNLKHVHLPLSPATLESTTSPHKSRKFATGVLEVAQHYEAFDDGIEVVKTRARNKIKVVHDDVLRACERFIRLNHTIEVIGWLVPETHYNSYRTLWCRRIRGDVETNTPRWKIGFEGEFDKDLWPSSNLDAVFA